MAKPGRIPDFRKLYPEASEEVIEVLRQTERKMQYQEPLCAAAASVVNPGGVHGEPPRRSHSNKIL